MRHGLVAHPLVFCFLKKAIFSSVFILFTCLQILRKGNPKHRLIHAMAGALLRALSLMPCRMLSEQILLQGRERKSAKDNALSCQIPYKDLSKRPVSLLRFLSLSTLA